MNLALLRIIDHDFKFIASKLELTVELLDGHLEADSRLLMVAHSGHLLFAAIEQLTPLSGKRYRLLLDFPRLSWYTGTRSFIASELAKTVCGLPAEEYQRLSIAEKMNYFLKLTRWLLPGKIYEKLAPHILPCCKLVLQKHKPGHSLSKFGGLPLAAPGFSFPKDKDELSMLFLGQLHIGELQRHSEAARQFAHDGLLYFFGEAAIENKEHFFKSISVLYQPLSEHYEEIPLPDELDFYGVFEEHFLHVEEEVSLPEMNSEIIYRADPDDTGAEVYEYLDLITSAYHPSGGIRLLGHPVSLQIDVTVEAEMEYREKMKPGKEYDYERAAKKATDWQLLLQIDIGENGIFTRLSNLDRFNREYSESFYVAIHKEDFREMKFDNTITVYQHT